MDFWLEFMESLDQVWITYILTMLDLLFMNIDSLSIFNSLIYLIRLWEIFLYNAWTYSVKFILSIFGIAKIKNLGF